MATISFTPTVVTGAAVSIGSRTRKANETKVVLVRGMNAYGGLKVHKSVALLGMPTCTEQCFAMIVSSLKTRQGRSGSGGGGGGALSAKCSKVAEIFQIAAIMNVLVLIGVAVGFALLRMEASVEESE